MILHVLGCLGAWVPLTALLLSLAGMAVKASFVGVVGCWQGLRHVDIWGMLALRAGFTLVVALFSK